MVKLGQAGAAAPEQTSPISPCGGTSNMDARVVGDFGREWAAFDQSGLPAAELQRLFNGYFSIFPWDALPSGAAGFDAGCGSGRWARLVAPRVGKLCCVDASAAALNVARRNLQDHSNVSFCEASVGDLPFPDGSMDFGYSLGVLHHVPDTQGALSACTAKLKPGAPFLVYLYYALETRPAWFRAVWRCADLVRQITSRLPSPLKHAVCGLIAAVVYWPLARLARAFPDRTIPLSAYKDASYYTMRTDALDRFGTRLEQRFTRAQIAGMMTQAGLVDLQFSEGEPYWIAVGVKAKSSPTIQSSDPAA
jgi:SAM-dependent methyltransferase